MIRIAFQSLAVLASIASAAASEINSGVRKQTRNAPQDRTTPPQSSRVDFLNSGSQEEQAVRRHIGITPNGHVRRVDTKADEGIGASVTAGSLTRWPPPHRLAAMQNCLGLNKMGFPLNVQTLLQQYPTKKEYFDHMQLMGYRHDMKVELRGNAGWRENTCSLPADKRSHFLFIGDCMARQSWQAYLRNGKRSASSQQLDDASKTELVRMAEKEDMILHMYENQTSTVLDERERGDGVAIAEMQHTDSAIDRTTRTITYKDASYIQWLGGDVEEAIHSSQRVLRQNGLDSTKDSITVWANVGIHPFFSGKKEWISDREAWLRKFVTDFKAEFPGVRIAWMTANYLDMDIMYAQPRGVHYERYMKNNVVQGTLGQVDIDESVMRSLDVPVVPRSDISSAYSGLQCDGIHHDPHDETHAEVWDCPGYPAIEDLILQSGLASICDKTGLFAVCAPS